MIRTLHVLLLIASLIACPFRCLGNGQATCTSSELAASCSCCAHAADNASQQESPTSPAGQQQEPYAPSNECECGSCLCDGAVLTDDDSIREDFFAGLWIVDFLVDSVPFASKNLKTELDESPPLFASIAGRSLRLALLSLQL